MHTVLVTGGAGFVGFHTVDALLARGYRVRILDALDPQVHGPAAQLLDERPPGAEFVRGDVRAPGDWARALKGVDAVIHLAAAVGVGQSMYAIRPYVEVNALGTALLLDAAVRRRPRLAKLVIASSMAVYGEGAARCPACGPVAPVPRPAAQLRAHAWEVRCPHCGATTSPCPTTEEHPVQPASVYAVTKRDQETLCLVVGKAYGIPVVALRYFNIYGPRQSLSNPYTGVVAIAAARLMTGQPPLVFEDGGQRRDFIHVHDVATANVLALESPRADGRVLNIGTGRPHTILEVCEALKDALGQGPPPRRLGQCREGDIRHCYAEPTRARAILGFTATIPFHQGIRTLAAGLKGQRAEDRVEQATAELAERGLLK